MEVAVGLEAGPMSGKRVALLICSNVVGGHEFQAAALGSSLARHVELTIFVNRPEHASLFDSAGLQVRVADGQLLTSGSLPLQLLNGWRHRAQLRKLVSEFAHVVVSAGAVEAGVAVGTALRGQVPLSMYLPFFYDRVPIWGWTGHLYNCVLGVTCRLFDRIVTINRIQARVVQAFTQVQTLVVGNEIRPVNTPVDAGPTRLVFIGRLDHQKRVGELLEWLDHPDNPIQELLLVGDGPLRQSLEAQAHGLKHLRCQFMGWMGPQEQDRLLRATDVLVLNSLLEGEPLVVREARARGMRIIARDIVGTRGVTRPAQRYASALELLKRLRDVTDQPVGLAHETSNAAAAKNSSRDQEVARLAERLMGGNPCAFD
jgi:glycosyltransferase involved in cell wall biosynthesis